MAFGLPIAIALGWTLATPARRPAPAAALPGAADGIGAAPERAATAEPVTAVRFSSRSYRPPAASPAGSTSPSPSPSASEPPAAASPSPSPSSSAVPPPPVLPPLPTPTEEITGPAEPSPPPPGEPSVNPPAS